MSKLNKVAEVELHYKSNVKSSERAKISSSIDAFNIFTENWDENKIELHEQFKVLLMSNANRVLGIYEMSSGGITGSVVDVRLTLIAALKAAATGIIIAHNHPSGALKTSEADKQITRKLKAACEVCDINLLDHLIITSEAYLSFADEGIL